MVRRILSFLAVTALIMSSEQSSFSQENAMVEANKKQIPVSYIENRGQWSPEVKYMAQLRGMNVWFTDKGLKYDVYTSRPATEAEIKQEKSRLLRINKEAAGKLVSGKPMRRSGQVIEMELVGASKLAVTGMEQQTSYRNYFIGRDKTKWQTGVPVFSKLRSEEVYPGIDVVYSFQAGKPRYDFVVKPGANPSSIALRFNGANNVSVSSDKGITLSTKLGDMYNGNIYAYQTINGREMQVPCEFTKHGEEVKFSVGNYDKNAPLVIDPLVYSTYFGGSAADDINGIKLDKTGNVVVAGGTSSPNFPYTKGAYDSTTNGGMDAFISKFDKTLTTLLYSTFIGGGSDEKANAVALDVNNSIFICGVTNSSNLPASGWKSDYSGLTDGFAAKISADGKTLTYCTYMGGTKDDQALCIAINPGGEACVGGETKSDNFPDLNAYKNVLAGGYDAFILKLRSGGGSVGFSTFMGGSGDDRCYAIDCDPGGSYIFVGGVTSAGLQGPGSAAGTYPVPTMMNPTLVPYNRTFNTGGFTDGWVAKMTDDIGAFSSVSNQFITYIGTNKNDAVRSLVVLKDGSCLVTGETEGGNVNKGFPHPTLQNKGGKDIFISKLAYDGRELLASTMFGGSGNESAASIAISSISNDIFVTGQTTSTDFQMSQLAPQIPPEQATINGTSDAFLARLNAGLDKVAYGTYYGGKGAEAGTSVVTTPRGDAYFAGHTTSDNIDISSFQYQPTFGGVQDGFISKIAFGTLSLISPNGGGSYCPGATVTIKWSKADGLTDADGIDIELSSDNGATWYKKLTTTPVVPLSFDWKIPSTQEPGTQYKLRLIHDSGIRDETSSPFVIGTPVQITENPVGDSVCPGTRVRFHVAGIGANLTYKWYKNGAVIPAESSDSLIIASAKAGDGAEYKVDVSAGCTPATSIPVTLVVKSPPKIGTQPLEGSAFVGGTYTFKVVATGKNLTYEWYKDGVKIQGATNSEHTIASANGGNQGLYKVIVRGECGADTSKEVKFEIKTGVDDDTYASKNVSFNLLSSRPVTDELTTTITSVTGCTVNVSLLDNLGREVMDVFNGTLDAGVSTVVSVNVKSLSSGIYWLTAKCGGDRTVQKVEIVR